ncbi:unnamed protein product, partial [Ectocarpus fasciculatus]
LFRLGSSPKNKSTTDIVLLNTTNKHNRKTWVSPPPPTIPPQQQQLTKYGARYPRVRSTSVKSRRCPSSVAANSTNSAGGGGGGGGVFPAPLGTCDEERNRSPEGWVGGRAEIGRAG